MIKVDIPKKSGGTRTIYVPTRTEKAVFRALLPEISQRVEHLPDKIREVIHGFRAYRSPVTMALQHVGHRWSICMDLSDFFPSVTEARLKGRLAKTLIEKVLIDGHAAQGLPTSPAVANLAASPMDKAILKWITKSGKQMVYTRYADDLTFSGDEDEYIPKILEAIPRIVSRCGFKVNPRKTHIYHSKGGRRTICGVSVGDNDIKVPRRTRRRLRAAQFQARNGVELAPQRAAGLLEWTKLKEPNPPRVSLVDQVSPREMQDQIRAVCAAWNLAAPHLNRVPDHGEDIDLGGDCIITGDPIYILGMSTYTTGWVSCMRHPSGAYRRGVIFWLHLRGMRISAYLSSRTATHGGVTRRLMKARAHVYQLRGPEGILVYNRPYGSTCDVEVLERQLVAHGVVPIREAQRRFRRQKVVGHAPARWKSYFDWGLHSSTTNVKGGFWAGKQVRVVYL